MNFDNSFHLKKALNDDATALKKATSFSRILKDSDERKEYVAREKKVTDFMHHGQRKLLISEIEFITTEYHKFNPIDQKILLYIGASTGHTSVHTYTLAKLFPEIEFHLWDRYDFYDKLYKLKNVKIMKRWFTEADSNIYQNLNVLLVSDLRNPDIKDTSDSQKTNQRISEDMELQMKFYLDIKPVSALFKFRLPWDDKDTEYLAGDIYFQAWETLRSTETRLIPTGWESDDSEKPKMKTYNNLVYEQQMFHFNTETRFQFYEHKYKCYCHCFDCRSEIDTLEKYIELKKLTICVCKIGHQISSDLSFYSKKNLLPKTLHKCY